MKKHNSKKDTSKHASKRTAGQIQQDRIAMIGLVRRGYTQSMIAEKLGVHQTQVSYDWKIVITQLRKEAEPDAKALLAQKLAEIREVKVQAWEAWERSKQDKVKRVEEQSDERECVVCGGGGKLTSGKPCFKCNGEGILGGGGKVVVTTEGQVGDVSFLRTVLSCIEQERILLALDPPKKTEITGKITSWDLFTEGIPTDKVPDLIEGEILKAETTMLPTPPPSLTVSPSAPLPGPKPPPESNGHRNGSHD